MADYDKLARDIRQRHLPWDEFSYLAAPGGVLDQLQADIVNALERAALEGREEALRCAAQKVLLQPTAQLAYQELWSDAESLCTRLAELKEGE